MSKTMEQDVIGQLNNILGCITLNKAAREIHHQTIWATQRDVLSTRHSTVTCQTECTSCEHM